MIISDQHRLAFVHIPKCAGTSIIQALKPYDSFPRDFAKPYEHPGLGRVNLDHFPLEILRTVFPDQFAKLEAYDAYAVIREPRARFASALFFHLGSVDKIDAGAQSLMWLRRRSLDICERLLTPNTGGYALTHFRRQVDFIRLEDRQVVANLYRLDDLTRLAGDLRSRYELVIDVETRRNEMRLADRPVAARIKSLALPLYSRLPVDLQRGLGRISKDWLSRSPPRLGRLILADPDLGRMVDAYYAEDAELYRSLAGSRGVVRP